MVRAHPGAEFFSNSEFSVCHPSKTTVEIMDTEELVQNSFHVVSIICFTHPSSCFNKSFYRFKNYKNNFFTFERHSSLQRFPTKNWFAVHHFFLYPHCSTRNTILATLFTQPYKFPVNRDCLYHRSFHIYR